jgi:hypothetical protein
MPPSATVAEIEARLRAGDESVTADEYLRADVDERFARLRAEAAAQAARDRAAAEHQERSAAFRASLKLGRVCKLGAGRPVGGTVMRRPAPGGRVRRHAIPMTLARQHVAVGRWPRMARGGPA